MTRNNNGVASFVAAAALLSTAAIAAERNYETDILRETFGFTDATQRSVELSDLHQGCHARDCIPAIDKPKFVAAADADHVDDNDVILAIERNGDARAYPTRILDRHEIVNDTIGGTPIAITYCPLCGSGVGVLRTVNGEVTEFGVSGVLYNSDLVLYDRNTETLWDQIEAKGIVGPLTGEQLEMVGVTMTRWGKWRKAHPDTKILSADTGFDIDYSMDPYARYRGEDRIMFPVSTTDDRIHPKTVVYGFEFDDVVVAYTHDLLEQEHNYQHELNGRALQVSLNDDGSVTLTDGETGRQRAPVRLFWFAWYSFHPDTELFRN